MNFTDTERANFLAALDDSDAVEVTAFEAGFLESNLDRRTFSESQRGVIDSMIAKYSSKIRW